MSSMSGINRRALIFAASLIAGALVHGGDVIAAPPNGTFVGNAFGTFANATAGPVATTLGRSALITCPCDGTNGQTRTNEVDQLQAGPGGSVLKADVIL